MRISPARLYCARSTATASLGTMAGTGRGGTVVGMDALRKALGGLSLLYALVFFAAMLLHSGVALGPLTQPVIIPASIVETVCSLAMLAGSYGALSGREWAWDGLIYTHAAALGGVLMGMLAIAMKPGAEATTLLLWYHGTIAAALAGGLGAAFYVSRVRPVTTPGSAGRRRPRRRAPR
ncbi:hypothetical protein OHA25_26305 [Nonomuraea sp. NBC_00507]|uniref:hypothetical protein n=1 Tax=Nonomuraea sp. NBC_00507 TaxID=2976002 RepID=UPI002E1952E8